MDATNGMSQIIDMIVRGLVNVFFIIDEFKFSGISMLDFLITLFIIGAALPIILAIVRTEPVAPYNAGRGVVRGAKRGFVKAADKAQAKADEFIDSMRM